MKDLNKILGLAESASDADGLKAVAALQEKLATFEVQAAEASADEKEILKKMAAGLDRKTAEFALKAQKEHDAKLAAKKKGTAKK